MFGHLIFPLFNTYELNNILHYRVRAGCAGWLGICNSYSIPRVLIILHTLYVRMCVYRTIYWWACMDMVVQSQQTPVHKNPCGVDGMPSMYAHKLKDTWSGASQFPANAVPLSGICMHIHMQWYRDIWTWMHGMQSQARSQRARIDLAFFGEQKNLKKKIRTQII